MEFSSHLLSQAVDQMSQLPGVGKRTALRLVLHLMRQPENHTDALASALQQMRHELNNCERCHNLSDTPVCDICNNPTREQHTICVVEDVRDVMAIESTGQYRGLYHILGGKISPLDGIGPLDLTIDALVARVDQEEVNEVIFALSPTVEGDTTVFYLFKKLENTGIKTSTIARGIAVGDELEYADQVTLGRSIIDRVPYDKTPST